MIREMWPNGVHIIDGGLSNVLEAAGHPLNTKLWSAELLDKNPSAIIKAHRAYILAGAEVITTASYQASIRGFTEHGFSETKALSLLLESVNLAHRAIQEARPVSQKKKVLVAASIGPYGAYLADGSEYRGNYGLSIEELEEFHSVNIDILSQSQADILACETIPDRSEAHALNNLLMKQNKPAWVSFSCKNESMLHDGSPIDEIIGIFKSNKSVFALGINCTPPQYISGLIDRMRPYIGNKKVLIYPNSGEVYNATTKKWHGTSSTEGYVNIARQWKDQGANMIGGCCRIGPEHIKALQNEL